MEYYTKSVIPIIESNYSKFTTLEKNVADFFIHNQKTMDFSSAAIANQLFVSKATLSRFAQKCGFAGYREFIFQYQESLVKKDETVTDHARLVFDGYQEILNKTYSLMDEAQIQRVCRYLGEARKVVVCGGGSSGLCAREMELRFMRIGVDIDSIQDNDLMRMQGVFQNEECLVIGISISGEKRAVKFLLQEAYKRKAKTVLITANNKEGYEEYCTEVILVSALKYQDHGNLISPQFPILVMTDIIYSYYLKQDHSIKSILHDDTLKALKGERKNEDLQI